MEVLVVQLPLEAISAARGAGVVWAEPQVLEALVGLVELLQLQLLPLPFWQFQVLLEVPEELLEEV
jgi:hypothetical protein